MTRLLCIAAALSLATPVIAGDLAGGNASEGYRIGAMDGGNALGVGQRFLLGPDGGTHATVFSGRARFEEFQFGLSVPFASYRTPMGRDKDVGNMQLTAMYDLPIESSMRMAAGVRVHFNLGENAYTWINAADEIWPGAGMDIVWEARMDGDTTKMLRASLGAHSAAWYDPFPNRYVRFQIAGGIEKEFADRLGVVGETSIQYWDLSPWELSGFMWVDIITGIRVRGGVVLPVAVWMGATPADQPAGLRETTLLVDVSAAF